MTEPRRGEVWWVDLEPSKGDEINKTRPSVVVSGDGMGVLKLKMIVPITSFSPAKVGKPWLTPLRASSGNGLKNDSVADVMQVRTVSLERFGSRMGRLSDEDLSEVVTALTFVVEFE